MTTSTPAEPTELVAPTGRRRRTARTDVDPAGLGGSGALAFVAPAMLLVIVFLVVPAFLTIVIGLTDFQILGAGADQTDYVGLANFRRAFDEGGLETSLWHSMQFVVGSAVIGQACFGFALAWVLRNRRGIIRRLVEAAVLVAWILPGSVVATLWLSLLDRREGTVHTLLDLPVVSWLPFSPDTAWLVEHPMWSIVIFNTWRGTAFSMMLYSAALSTVPPSQLETARMAGASGWQQLRDVVFPSIRGHILTNLLLITLWTFNDFTPFLLTKGQPGDEADIMPIYIFEKAVQVGDLGFGSAISLIMLLCNLVLAGAYLAVLGRRRAEGSVA